MSNRWTSCLLALASLLFVPALVHADQWNQRTQLHFDGAVQIPGTTLAPGEYTFRLLDSSTDRHVVVVLDAAGRVRATTIAVPARRQETRGDVVLKFNPAAAGEPPAIKAWFYPGALYGHEFVYPDRQARDIAERTRTIVLGDDSGAAEGSTGQLFVYSPGGSRAVRHEDATLAGEWSRWANDQSGQGNPNTATIFEAERRGTRVTVEDLEEHGRQYIGKTVSVDGEVEKVLAPRLFSIDEPDWADLDPELLVYVPSDLAAMVRSDDRITVTGVVRAFVRDDLASVFDGVPVSTEQLERFTKRPVLVATRVIGGDDNRALLLRLPETNQARSDAESRETVGTSGREETAASGTAGAADTVERAESAAAVSDIDMVTGADRRMVGRPVALNGVPVEDSAPGGAGFWVHGNGGRSVFILPSDGRAREVKQGQAVSIHGVILQMPPSMRQQLRQRVDGNGEVYVYASRIEW